MYIYAKKSSFWNTKKEKVVAFEQIPKYYESNRFFRTNLNLHIEQKYFEKIKNRCESYFKYVYVYKKVPLENSKNKNKFFCLYPEIDTYICI